MIDPSTPGEGFNGNGLRELLTHLAECADQGPAGPLPSLNSWAEKMAQSEEPMDKEVVAMLAYCYELLSSMNTQTASVLKSNTEREELHTQALTGEFEKEAERNRLRDAEASMMEAEDAYDGPKLQSVKIGSHLMPKNRL